jgi:predicted metal-binding membrane protein
VLRRDRVVIVLAVALLTAFAWSYLLWLSADMHMGGINMTGLRMIPLGIGLMMPADMPWRALEFAFVFAMWIVMMVGMMTPSAAPMFLMYARVGRQTEPHGKSLRATVWFARLFPGLGRLRALRHIGAMGVRAQCFARFHHGKHGQRPRRARVRCGRPVPMDPAE